MTKADLIKTVMKEAKISTGEATKAVNSLTEAITEEVKKGGRISLPGFGTFSLSNREPRTGRNPRTGQEIRIPARKTVKFKAAKGFKESVK